MSCLVQYLDGAVAAVDPDPVAGVQAHGGVAASDDGGDAEFAGHDRSVGERRADVGYDRGGAGEDRGPADVGDRGGEILVTTVTNIGWTPTFPRAAAVVTDVGAPLSHAAIVARELGIPAVVGCGNATMLLHSGDRVRVDGSNGTVEVLHQA